MLPSVASGSMPILPYSASYICRVIEPGLVGSTDFRGFAGAENAQGTPAQSHISPSILVYEDKYRYIQGAKVEN